MYFHTYRSRLIIYGLVLFSFLIIFQLISASNARETVTVEAERSLQRLAQLFTERLHAEKTELENFAIVLRDDKRLQEYLFITVEFDSGKNLLLEHYKKQFGWLPIDKTMIVSKDGTIILGQQSKNYIDSIAKSYSTSTVQSTYTETDHGLELIANAPIEYKGDHIGTMILVKHLDNKWLQAKTNNSISELIVENNGAVQYSTIPGYQSGQHMPSNKQIEFADSIYRISPIRLNGLEKTSVKLWFGASFTEAHALLLKHRNESYLQIIIGCLIIFFLGWLISRNFDQPLAQLAALTEQISSGHLPSVEKAQASTEIGALKNQFVDMVHALREKDAQVKIIHKELEKIAVTDSLTGLNNRRAFEAKLSTVIYNTKKNNEQHALCFLDLDKFKIINDTCGHEAGDELLRQLTKLILTRIRKLDMLARLGGDEFGLILSNIGESDASLMANVLVEIVRDYKFAWKTKEFSVGVSIGMLMLDKNCENVIEVMRLADSACYYAKNTGRNKFHIFRHQDEDRKSIM